MRKLLQTGIITAFLATGGCATTYGGGNFLGMTGGQHAERIDENSWQIDAAGNGYAGSKAGEAMALYKAGVVTRATGHTHFQVYSFEIFYNGYGAQSALLKIHPTNDPDAEFECESWAFRVNCRTVSADWAIEHYRADVKQSKAQTDAEVAALRAQYHLGDDAAAAAP
ncbi:hypothetical protein [Stakelama tenebrarum]|uniref:Lipoprotein n=1 Tax=Stakelama tenebrarum TaxID=2711215 RepID=A0A6G6Y2D5_9SPHN|nr:hypothetical protein [Sphingosinithalassobacter tenebrarum]QIG78967.1 hypothetical protein G5C33_03650 [Sphingosinithalassobacter tenebrarum]